jgi:hypothetical protein
VVFVAQSDAKTHKCNKLLGNAVRKAAPGLTTVIETLKNARQQCEAEFGAGGGSKVS